MHRSARSLSFLRTSLSVVATQTAVAPIALLTQIALARGLSVADRGLYAAASELAVIAAVVFELGWSSTAIYRIRQTRRPPAEVAGAALCVCAVVSAVAVAGGIVFDEAIRARFLTGADPRLLHLALATIPFQLAGVVFAGVARGVDRFPLQNAYRLSNALLLLTGISIVLLLRGGSLAALAALLATHALTATALVVLVLRSTGFALGPLRDEIRRSLQFGLLSHVQKILSTLHQRIDLLLLAWLSEPEVVALYAVAVGVINRVRILPMSIALALYPTIAGQSAEQAGRFTARVSRHALALVVGTVLGLGLLAPLLVPLLFGERYGASVLPLILLLPAAAFLSPGLILARYFTARARQPRAIAILAFATAINVLLNLLWIPEHGASGAAAASSVSYGVQWVLMLVSFSAGSGVGLGETTLLTADDLNALRARTRDWWRRRAGR